MPVGDRGIEHYFKYNLQSVHLPADRPSLTARHRAVGGKGWYAVTCGGDLAEEQHKEHCDDGGSFRGRTVAAGTVPWYRSRLWMERRQPPASRG